MGALSDILWKAGDRQRAVLCLTQDTVYLKDEPSVYQSDGCTERVWERLHIFSEVRNPLVWKYKYLHCLKLYEMHLFFSFCFSFQIHTFEFKKQDELTFNLKKYLFEVRCHAMLSYTLILFS